MSILNTVALDIRRAADDVRRLGPSHRKPEKFHEDKSCIVALLGKLADVLEGKCEFVEEPPAKPAFKPGAIRVEGRVIYAETRFRRTNA